MLSCNRFGIEVGGTTLLIFNFRANVLFIINSNVCVRFRSSHTLNFKINVPILELNIVILLYFKFQIVGKFPHYTLFNAAFQIYNCKLDS